MFRIRAVLIAFFCLFSASAAGAGDMTYNAEITVDGRLERRIPLSAHQGREVFTIQTAAGSNTICVEDASIAVISADCRDAVCVNTGKA